MMKSNRSWLVLTRSAVRWFNLAGRYIRKKFGFMDVQNSLNYATDRDQVLKKAYTCGLRWEVAE